MNTTKDPPEVRLFPAESRPVKVIVDGLPELMVPELTATVLCERERGPGTTVTEGEDVVTGVPLIVALNAVGVPINVPVNVAVYVPLPTLVVPLKLPVETPPPVVRVNTTVSPPVGIKLLFASLAVRVTVTFDPEATVADDTVIKDVAGEIAPGSTSIVGEAVATNDPLIVARIVVGLPAVNPVKVAV